MTNSNVNNHPINYKCLKDNHYKLMKNLIIVYNDISKDIKPKSRNLFTNFSYLLARFFTELYIKKVNMTLINAYLRLKIALNCDSEKEFKNKLWLMKTINDCKQFDSSYSIFNIKIFSSLSFSFITPLFGFLLKNLSLDNIYYFVNFLLYMPLVMIIFCILNGLFIQHKIKKNIRYLILKLKFMKY